MLRGLLLAVSGYGLWLRVSLGLAEVSLVKVTEVSLVKVTVTLCLA